MTTDSTPPDDEPSPLTDPEVLRDRADVAVEERHRPLPDEKFEGLKQRYDAIGGVVQIGLTNDDAVLLWGDDSVAPPGGSVGAGEDWIAAARETMEDLTGQQVEIDRPLMLEITHFQRESDESESFPAPSVHFAASLVDPDPEWVADPEPPADYEEPMFEERPRIRWFDAVTDDVDENHAHHVELYLD